MYIYIYLMQIDIYVYNEIYPPCTSLDSTLGPRIAPDSGPRLPEAFAQPGSQKLRENLLVATNDPVGFPKKHNDWRGRITKNNQKHKHQPHPTTKCVVVAVVFIAVAVAFAVAATAAADVVVVLVVLLVLFVVVLLLLVVVSHGVFSCKCQTATHISSCENDTPKWPFSSGKS